MELYARQGDLVFARLDKIDGTTTKEIDLVFAGDSSGHRHRLLGVAQVYRRDEAVQFQIAEPTTLVHEKAGGHGPLEFPPGCYEMRRQRERGDASDRAVED